MVTPGPSDVIASPFGGGLRCRAAVVAEVLVGHDDLPYDDWRLVLWSAATARAVEPSRLAAGD